MKRPWLAALLNFFFMGAGTLYVGRRKGLGIGLTLGALALTYVENSLQKLSLPLWGTMFAAILVMNTLLALDGHREAKEANG
jgi:hypothetical protein